MWKALLGASVLAIMSVCTPGAAVAQEGLSGLHEWVKVGRKTCMVDHFHDGAGTGPTKAQAQAAAVRSWQDFTAWEYSDRWARFSAALSKSVTCTGTRGNITCNVSARPCRV